MALWVAERRWDGRGGGVTERRRAGRGGDNRRRAGSLRNYAHLYALDQIALQLLEVDSRELAAGTLVRNQ